MIMFDCRGFFIESAARNIPLQAVADHLNIGEERLLAKLVSEDLLTLTDASQIKSLFNLHGSAISINGLFEDRSIT